MASPADMERFNERLRALLASLAGRLPDGALRDAARLIEHNEAGEGLLVIADVIIEEGVEVPPTVVREIRDLGDGLVDEWPQGFGTGVAR